jgi:hypothetical protein
VSGPSASIKLSARLSPGALIRVPISGGFVLACQLLQQGCVQQLVQSANATESSTRSPTPEPRPEAPALGINYPTPTVVVLFVAEEALSVAECVSPVA